MSGLFRLEVEGVPVTWRVARVEGTERLHEPFEFRVTVELADREELEGAPALEAAITSRARISWAVDGVGDRVLDGLVDEVERAGSHLVVTVVHGVALLEDAVDYRVFVDKDPMAIVAEVLGLHGIELDVRLEHAPPPRAQCVQAFESDLAFISRLIAEEGVTWYVPREGRNVLVATDHARGFERIDGTLSIVEASGMISDRSARGLRLAYRVATDTVSLRDYDFRAPQLDLAASTSATHSGLECYEFPGGFRDVERGRRLSQMRLEERSARALVLEAEVNARDLAPGCVITIRGGHPDASGDWLLTEVVHDGRDHAADAGERRYTARIVAVPASTPYRSERTSAATVRGVQTATVTGPRSQELHTEQHGRVTARLRWDRRASADERSSDWIRAMQPPTSGAFFLPRVGWEILAGFLHGSADAPVVLGRVYNGHTPAPAVLPRQRTGSAFGTRTTPAGDSGHRLALEDGAKHEELAFESSRDFNERTENDKVTVVTGDEHATLGGRRKLSVGQVHVLEIGGTQSHTVTSDRTLNVDANMATTASSERIAIGGTRSFKVGGDMSIGCTTLTRMIGAAKAEVGIEHETREVGGAAATFVAGSWNALGGAHASVSVAGASTEAVGGPKRIVAGRYFLGVKGALTINAAAWNVSAGGSHAIGSAADVSLTAAGSASFKGAHVIFAAQSKLTIRASGIVFELTPGGVKIDGRFEGTVASVDLGDEAYA